LFVAQQELARRLTCLEQILHDKDRQIQEYQKLGIKIPKSLQVPVFDKKTFESDAINSNSFTANLNRPIKRLKAPTTDIIAAYQNYLITQSIDVQPQESDSDDVFENKHETKQDKVLTKSLSAMASLHSQGVGLFSLELHDEGTTRATTETTTKLKLMSQEKSLSATTTSTQNTRIPQESAEELERRKQIKDKLKKEKEKREQVKKQKKRKFV